MLHNFADPGVWIIAAIALSISGFSLYFARVQLPAKMKSAYLKSITVLAAAVETKDSGTIGHAQRVCDLSMVIAQRLGIEGAELERVEYAALLRDIGKANVPYAVLNKRDPLTDEEWSLVQNHAKQGAEMVKSVPFLADCVDLILHHHEYCDGSGYPDGLKREEIPLGSRILAATSDYDAMISERPYHPVPMTSDEAMAEIRAGSGTKYDPVVVEILAEVLGNYNTETAKAA